MFYSVAFDLEVEAILTRYERSGPVCQNAVELFKSELKLKREKAWENLLRKKNIYLSSAMPLLININNVEYVWQTLDNRSKDYIYAWQKRANFTIF